MKKMIVRGISILLAFAMILSFVPMLHTEAKAVTVNQQNIADRADFFFNTTWVCQKNVNAWRDEFVFQKGETYHLPYGQPVNSGKFIGYGVELEDFLMAAADGDSVFYSRQSEFNGWTSVYYATDCAAFVAMCWGTVRQDCSTLPYYSTYKGRPTEANIHSILQLGDALDSTSVGHVVLVSDLIYDDNGDLVQIEITEQTPPQLKRTYFTPSELAAKYGEEFGIYRYEGSVPAVPEWGYTTECTNYAAHCILDVTADTPIMSLPCTSAEDAESVGMGTALKGQSYTATRLYDNTADELWYRIKLEGDKVGYIAADNTIYKEMLLDDIMLTDAVYPNAHVRGKTFSLVGNVYSRYNQLVTAYAYIYQGFGANGSPKTGASDYVTGNAYTLKSSQIDYSTSFGDLTTGNHTMAIGTNYRNYYVKDGTVVENAGTLKLAEEYFMVVSSSASQSSCNHRYTQTVLSVGSCTQTGLSVFACSSCGHVYKQEDEAVGHSFSEWSITNATCTKDGLETRNCTLCGETETKVLAAVGHQYSETIIEGSCQECPHSVFTCDTCGDHYAVYPEEVMSPWQEDLPEDIDQSLIETKTQYRYSDLEIILSAEKELEGHINLGETWEPIKTETLDYVKQWPAGFDTENHLYSQYNKTPVNGSESGVEKVIIDSDAVTGYLYYHWCYEGSYFSQAAQSGHFNIFHAYYSTTKPDSYRVDTSDNSYCTAHDSCSNTDWFFVVEVNTQTITTQQIMYRQGHWLDYGEWSDDPSEANDTRRVETRTMYRYPDINAVGHQYEITEIAPTCTENGSITKVCAVCGDIQVQTLPAVGHKYESEITAPTCTEEGYTTYVCSCGDSYIGDNVAPLGHNYDSVVIEGSCTEDGSVTKTCDLCGDTQTQTVPAIGHQYDAQVTAPTCTEKGYTTYTCHCGDSYIGEETAAAGHNYQTKIEDATCTENGSINAICSVCGDTKIGIIPATGHSYQNGFCSTCGAEEKSALVKPTLKLKAPTLEFKDMITVNAFFTAENIEDVVEMGMITYSYKADVVSVETAEHRIPGAAYIESSGRYLATSQGIHAKYLGDTVYLACYAELKDGSHVYTILAPYSPVDYATNQIKNSTNVQLKQLCAAMLNYGAEAQLFFGHNTSALANASLTDEQKALPEAYRADMVAAVPAASAAKQGAFANNKGFAKRTPSISFEGAFCINYFFTPNYAPVDGITMYYWNEADYNAVDVLTTENASGSFKMDGTGASQYNGSIEGIAAKALSKAVYVAATYSDGTTTWTSGVLGYSIGSYCSSQASKGAAVSNLAMATAVYGYQAKQYFG